MNTPPTPETSKPITPWGQALASIRGQLGAAMEQANTAVKITAFIALAGLLNWCPRCGEWQGDGSEGSGPNVPNPKAAPIPKRLLRAISSPLADEPTALHRQPSRDHGLLKRNSGILETSVTNKGEEAKVRHWPASEAHGRKMDVYYGGEPRPDSYPHGHEASFVRGDGDLFPLYDRLKDGTVVHETNTDVIFSRQQGVYEWLPKPQRHPNQEL